MARTVARQRSSDVVVIRYLRVSKLGDRKLGSEEFHSPRVQMEAINAELDRQYGAGRWRPVDVVGNFIGEHPGDGVQGTWADLGVSGRSMERAGLDAAINAVGEHRAGALAVYNLSRWGRNVVGAMRRIGELEAQGTALVSAQETIDFKTPEGWFSTTLFLMMAELFSRQKGREWAGIIEGNVRRGRHHGVIPVGYERKVVALEEGTRRMIVPTEGADAIKQAFEMVANGASRTAAGMWLRDQGLVARPTSAHKILVNRFYVRRHAASCAGTDCKVVGPHGPYGEVRVGSGWHPGTHEGIIDSALFERVQARIGEARESGTRQRVEAVHELAGILRCGTCGYVLGGHTRKGTSRVVFQDSNGRLRGCPGAGMVTADRILDVVRSEMDSLIEATESEAAVYSLKPSFKPDTRKKLVERRARALDRIGELNAKLAVGDFTGSREQAVRREVESLERIVADTDDALARAVESHAPARGDVLTQVRHLLEQWDDLTVTERNAALRQMLTVYVQRKPEGAAFRMPYADRLSFRWAWETAAAA